MQPKGVTSRCSSGFTGTAAPGTDGRVPWRLEGVTSMCSGTLRCSVFRISPPKFPYLSISMSSSSVSSDTGSDNAFIMAINSFLPFDHSRFLRLDSRFLRLDFGMTIDASEVSDGLDQLICEMVMVKNDLEAIVKDASTLQLRKERDELQAKALENDINSMKVGTQLLEVKDVVRRQTISPGKMAPLAQGVFAQAVMFTNVADICNRLVAVMTAFRENTATHRKMLRVRNL